MSGITDVGAVAGATEQVAKDAAPIISQQVSQAYENAAKSRSASILDAVTADLTQAGNRAALGALVSRVLVDAEHPTPGLGPDVAIPLDTLTSLLECAAELIERNEQSAAK